jgi:hypothetical protein
MKPLAGAALTYLLRLNAEKNIKKMLTLSISCWLYRKISIDLFLKSDRNDGSQNVFSSAFIYFFCNVTDMKNIYGE